MLRVVLLLLGAALSALAWQNAPRLRRVGPASQVSAGNLDGFRPVVTVWPRVSTDLRDGSKIQVSALVSAGKPQSFRVTGDVNGKLAQPFLDALKQWRFTMPSDGTTPVTFTVTWQASHGHFMVQSTSASLR